MKTVVAGLAFAFTVAASAASAQPAAFPPNEMGVNMGHWHLNSRDPEANKKIFAAMGGRVIKRGNGEVALFPGVVVFLQRGQGGAAPTGGTVGSVVNHVGFIVQDVQAQVAKWKAAGIAVEPGGNGRLDQAYVNTPDGLRIEILEDKNQPWPIRNEHVHFQAPASEIPKMQAWYAKEFGGHAWTRNNAPVVDLPGVQLRFAVNNTPQVSTSGRVLDHIGFDVKNLDQFMKKLEADGVKIERPINRDAQTGAALAFISDPWGTMIELNDRPTPIQ